MTEKPVHSPPVKLLYVGQLKDGRYHGKGKLCGIFSTLDNVMETVRKIKNLEQIKYETLLKYKRHMVC